ncbi:uncharacterized protein cd8b [Chanos chanos]|uniref:Uncharacterized protein cd8b n=1 Tax=Chanos chanos TaxID=29144 RepID=A0A6J2UWZ5_CHACN|nr:uncharacterized protein LOC115807135 [Chanos chanos]
MTLTHILTLVCLWTQVAKTRELYPKVGGSETLTCECPDRTCQRVFWYRFLKQSGTYQFLMQYNSAGRELHADGVSNKTCRGSVREGVKTQFSLRLLNLQPNDTGVYSCVLQSTSASQQDLYPPGYFIRPGAGCEPEIIWTLTGLVATLAVVLTGTLYYFSRLPKKCRHNFIKKKKRQSVLNDLTQTTRLQVGPFSYTVSSLRIYVLC